MKKIIIGSLMILAVTSTAFAGMHNRDNVRYNSNSSTHKMRNCDYRRDARTERDRILIEEKKLDVRKELLNEKPDWNKIEKLNIDIATQEAKLRTSRMREKFEAKFNNQNPLPTRNQSSN